MQFNSRKPHKEGDDIDLKFLVFKKITFESVELEFKW